MPKGKARPIEERAMDSLPVMSPREWARLAILCLDQAGVSAATQKKIEKVVAIELWVPEL